MDELQCSVLAEVEHQENIQAMKEAARTAERTTQQRRERIDGEKVDKLAELLSNKIDKLRADSNRISFTIRDRHYLERLNELSAVEGLGLGSFCQQVIIDFIEDLDK